MSAYWLLYYQGPFRIKLIDSDITCHSFRKNLHTSQMAISLIICVVITPQQVSILMSFCTHDYVRLESCAYLLKRQSFTCVATICVNGNNCKRPWTIFELKCSWLYLPYIRWHVINPPLFVVLVKRTEHLGHPLHVLLLLRLQSGTSVCSLAFVPTFSTFYPMKVVHPVNVFF